MFYCFFNGFVAIPTGIRDVLMGVRGKLVLVLCMGTISRFRRLRIRSCSNARDAYTGDSHSVVRVAPRRARSPSCRYAQSPRSPRRLRTQKGSDPCGDTDRRGFSVAQVPHETLGAQPTCFAALLDFVKNHSISGQGFVSPFGRIGNTDRKARIHSCAFVILSCWLARGAQTEHLRVVFLSGLANLFSRENGLRGSPLNRVTRSQ